MGAVAGQRAVRCRPDPFCVAQNSRSAGYGVESETNRGLEFPGWTDPARRAVGTRLPFRMVAGIDVGRIRPDLVSRLRVVRETASANRGPPTGLDGTGPCAGLRRTPHRWVSLCTVAQGHCVL